MNLGKPRKARIISSPESACLNREEDAGFADPFPHGLPFFNSSLRPARRKPMKKEGKP